MGSGVRWRWSLIVSIAAGKDPCAAQVVGRTVEVQHVAKRRDGGSVVLEGVDRKPSVLEAVGTDDDRSGDRVRVPGAVLVEGAAVGAEWVPDALEIERAAIVFEWVADGFGMEAGLTQ